MSEHATTSSTHKNTGSAMNPPPSWVWIAITFFIFIVVLFSIPFKKRDRENIRQRKKSEQTVQVTTRWIIDERKTINYTGEYGEIIYNPTERGVSFENSSEPYCVKNLDNVEICGQKGEDISPKVPSGNASTGVMFKSSNGKPGKITMVIWVKLYEATVL